MFLTGARIEVTIPTFLTEPVESFSLTLSLQLETNNNNTGTLFGFGFQNISNQLTLLDRVYSFKVSVLELTDVFNDTDSQTVFVIKHLFNVFIGANQLQSEEVDLDIGTWYTIGLTFSGGSLNLYFNGENVMSANVDNRAFISQYLTSHSRILIGSHIPMSVKCLQIYTESLSPAQVLVGAHRCTEGGKYKNYLSS